MIGSKKNLLNKTTMTALINENIEFTKSLSPSKIQLSEELKTELFTDLKSAVLPTTRVENWKYTRVAKLGKISFKSTNDSVIDSIEEFKIVNAENTLVFINGIYNKNLSSSNSIDGVEITLLDESNGASNFNILPTTTVFEKSNINYLNGGVKINVRKNLILDQPIQVLHILDGNEVQANIRIEIEAEQFSESQFVFGYFDAKTGEKSFCNTSSYVSVGPNAKVSIDKIQNESISSFHINKEIVDQAKDSTFTINTITLNGGLVRNDLNINVNGENSCSNLNGAYLTKEGQHVDNHTIVDHKVPNCESHELYKGVMDEKSTGVFNGKVFVRQDAQKINAFQSNGNVLLDNDSAIYSKPELEIYADDVKCSHGSTTGQLDDEAVFYLRARGLSESSAKQLMISAFVGDVLHKIENEEVLEYIHKVLRSRFGWDF